MRVRVLGPVGVWAGSEEVAPGLAGKPRGVLAMLALAGGRPVSPDALVTGLWGEDAPLSAGKTLQVHVSTVRARLKPTGATVVLTPAGYRLDVAPDDIDVVRFESLAKQAAAALAEDSPEAASRLFQAALAEWTGTPLEGVGDLPFAAHEGDRLALRRLAVSQSRIEADLALGLGAALVDDLREVAAANPYDERTCQQLVLALYRAGQPVAALGTYREFRRTMGEELGLEVGPELVELERQILVHDERLLARPVGTSTRRSNLPAEVSSFIGRDAELVALRASLAASRLTTVTGVGGAGKTRLALAAAGDVLDDMPAGVWFTDLSALPTDDLVVTTVAQTLGSAPDDGPDGVAELIGSRRLLLVLDNCEHVVDVVSELVGSLLRRCPDLRVLATSREPLGVSGERIYRVPPLGLAGPTATVEQIRGCDAVRLFVDRARAHRDDFAVDDANADVVGQLCERLDGVPLAIELAAARLRMFSIEDLAGRLDERFRVLIGNSRDALPRQRTLRALIDWSYDLLAPDERELLMRLSVFAGAFDLDAAEAIGADAASIEVLDVLTALVDKSLVEVAHHDSNRFRLLETIRQYAAERLVDRPAIEVLELRMTHARHYLAIAASFAPFLERTSGPVDAVAALTAEHANLLAAAETLLAADAVAESLDLVIHLHRWWELQGQCAEGADLAARVLAHPLVVEHPDRRVEALCTHIDMLERLGDLDAAEPLAEQAEQLAVTTSKDELRFEVALRRALVAARRDHLEQAVDHLQFPDAPTDHQLRELNRVQAYIHLCAGRMDAARRSLVAAVDAARRTANDRRLASFLSNLACVDMAEGDLVSADANLEEARTLAARVGDRVTVGYATVNQALTALLAADHPTAQIRYRETLLHVAVGNDEVLTTSCLLGMSLCAGAAGDAASAAILLGYVDAAVARSATNLDPTEHGLLVEHSQRLTGLLGDGEFERLASRGRALSTAEAIAFARHRRDTPEQAPDGEQRPVLAGG